VSREEVDKLEMESDAGIDVLGSESKVGHSRETWEDNEIVESVFGERS
jgi:hypothetical protein